MRERRLGQWQGSLDVPAGSVVLCAGFTAERDALLMELMVVLFRNAAIDARSIWIDEPQQHPGADKTNLVSAIFIIYPQNDNIERWRNACREFRQALPQAVVVTLCLIDDKSLADEALVQEEVDIILRSHSECLAFIGDMQRR